MTSKEAVEDLKLKILIIKDYIEYITRLDYVDPIVRGEVRDILYEAYHKTTPEFDIIKKDLEMLEIYRTIDEEIGIDYITLNKLRKADKIYVKFCNIQEYHRFKIDLRECKILLREGKGYLQLPLSEYNKGFSLSKEELEND